jgi:hypothetical protein
MLVGGSHSGNEQVALRKVVDAPGLIFAVNKEVLKLDSTSSGHITLNESIAKVAMLGV